MDIKIINTIFLIILLGFLSSSSCEKPKRQCSRDYRFEEDFSIYPAKDTFQIGDTFFIEVKTPTKMHDLAENSYIEMRNHGIVTYLHIYQINSKDSNGIIDPQHSGYEGALTPNANSRFLFKSKIGSWTLVGNHSAKIEYDTLNGNFVHKTAVIVKDTGLFYFRFFDAIGYYIYNYGNNPNLIETECVQYWEYMKLTVNSGKTNFFLIEERGITIRRSEGTNGDTQEYNCKHGSWSFVVVPKSTP